MTRPTVSVLVTTYNHERWVREALDSLMAQTFDDFEVIITDDRSDDDTVDIVREWIHSTGFPATLIVNNLNVGIAAVRNAALRVARGEFVCCLSGDDRYTPRRIELQQAALAGFSTEVAGVFSDMRLIDADGQLHDTTWLESISELPPPTPEAQFRRLLAGSFMPAPAVMVRRSALDAVGPYDETLVFEDYDMWLRIADRFEIRFVPGNLVDYRIHPHNLSRRPDRATEFMVDATRVQSKWRGRHPDVDWANARRAWMQGRELMATDQQNGRQMLELAEELVPGPTAALALELDRLNRQYVVDHDAKQQQLHQALHHVNTDLGKARAKLDVTTAELRHLVDAIRDAHLTAGALLRSRWLHVLDVLERPVRWVRPGLGTVRSRLNRLWDQLDRDSRA